MAETVALPLVPPHDGLAGGIKYRAIFAVSLSVLLSVLDYAVANVALPTIAHDIHTDSSSVIWVVNAYQLASVMSLLPLAALGDRLGHARVCRIGLILFVVASLLCAASTSLPELAAARALQGFGSACIMSVNAALLRFIYPAKQLGRGIAFNGSVVAVAVALGPTIAAGVLSVAGWQWLFLINLPLGGAALFFAVTSLPRTPRYAGRLDWLSAGLLATALAAFIIGGDSLAHRHIGLVPLILLPAGLVSLLVLVPRQLKIADPLLPVDLLALPGFCATFITGILGFVASNFFVISVPFNLENSLHRSAITTGLLITPWPVAIALVAPFVGRLTDRYSAAVLSSIGLVLTGSGFLALYMLPPAPTNFDIAWRIGLAGAGFGLFQPPNNKAMIATVPPSRIGSASGMISFSRLLGQATGAMLVAITFGLVAHGATVLCLAFGSGTAFLAALVSASRLRHGAAA